MSDAPLHHAGACDYDPGLGVDELCLMRFQSCQMVNIIHCM